MGVESATSAAVRDGFAELEPLIHLSLLPSSSHPPPVGARVLRLPRSRRSRRPRPRPRPTHPHLILQFIVTASFCLLHLRSLLLCCWSDCFCAGDLGFPADYTSMLQISHHVVLMGYSLISNGGTLVCVNWD